MQPYRVYKAEQFLTIDICEADILYTVHGRADGIIEANNIFTICKWEGKPLPYFI